MKPPVFVIGTPRSGTTLLHHMLLSAGGFASYETESNVFNMLIPTFGDLQVERNRQQLLNAWLQSHLFRASGLEAESIRMKMLADCRSGGDFLRILMEEIAHNQHVDRWTEHTPSHLFHMSEIKKAFGNALFVHVIRDGRDVAVSLGKTGWFQSLPLPSHTNKLAAGLFWNWMVGQGRSNGKDLGADYMEVRYEELVLHPRLTLARIGEFIQHDLDYDRIQRAAIGAVRKPNTSFVSEANGVGFNPIGRWKRDLTGKELSKLEFIIGDLLDDLGYPLASMQKNVASTIGLSALRGVYLAYFDSLLWLKKRTPLHRYVARRDIDYRISH